jgi:hypothetical protein
MPGLKMEPGSFVIHVSVLGIPDTLRHCPPAGVVGAMGVHGA